MFGIGMPELIIIEIGAGMGKAIRNFKGATSEPEKKEPDKIEENKEP
ncbi:MAG: twin-arginine translocase TatA/TatE family subunit [Deltaproteobacteria bacterium]|nr:twin-arginine translocase TatA/TatE family subunit [Deltaproteobacteria bacterium]